MSLSFILNYSNIVVIYNNPLGYMFTPKNIYQGRYSIAFYAGIDESFYFSNINILWNARIAIEIRGIPKLVWQNIF